MLAARKVADLVVNLAVQLDGSSVADLAVRLVAMMDAVMADT